MINVQPDSHKKNEDRPYNMNMSKVKIFSPPFLETIFII